ncbi:hypothetical protein G9A89_014543 [Geosiphon pyriformis]|nr:hypothetical protein G9A89_014543 [Geosiphon pyriformis]
MLEVEKTKSFRFAKSLFQQYSQQLRLNNNHFSAESVFNFYINNKITNCLGGTVNIESTRKNFYTELFQHTSLPKNYSFAPIIKKINQIIERYTQQQFPIIYTNKSKRRLQTLAVTSKEIQLLMWKKTKIELPTNLLYYYTPGSTINITSTDLLEPYGVYFEEFKSQLPMPSGLQSLSPQPDFGTMKFTYQNPIPKNPEQHLNLKNLEIETLNFQTPQNLNNTNPKTINQQNLSPQLLQPPQQPQQPLQQSQQQLQQPNLDLMIYTPIAKLEKFTDKEGNAQEFKIAFLGYFSNNNSINCLANTFTTIKQGETETVITYLECFHKNLCQIQAIQADYFTASQILNQFICGLYSSILQHVRSMHPVDLQATITNARDFETAKLEANHTQAVNLVINRLSELDSKLKQFRSHSQNSGTGHAQNLNSQHYLSLLITSEDVQPNNPKTNQQPTLISNILPATITENESLNAIFPFELEELLVTPLFSEATLKEKPITAMYTDVKVDGYPIKLILDSGLADSIITRQLIDQLDY